jgi:hypothetical protein
MSHLYIARLRREHDDELVDSTLVRAAGPEEARAVARKEFRARVGSLRGCYIRLHRKADCPHKETSETVDRRGWIVWCDRCLEILEEVRYEKRPD